MRESVRLQKPAFYETLQSHKKQVILLLSYHAKEIHSSEKVDKAITPLLQKIIGESH